MSLLQWFWVISGDPDLDQLGFLLSSRTAEEWLPWKVNIRIRRMEQKRAEAKGTLCVAHRITGTWSRESGSPQALEMPLDPSAGSKRAACNTRASCKEWSRDPAGAGKPSRPSRSEVSTV